MPAEAVQTVRETRTTCPYCGVGCGVIVETLDGRVSAVRGDPSHPANFGRLCSKGSTLHLTAAPHIAAQARLLQPMRRRVRGQAPQAVAWDDALDHAAATLGRLVREHGPDSIGFYVSGQLLTEDYHVFNKLAKGLLGTNNIDTNSRLCMSSAVAGYKRTLGADAPPACYDDVNHASCLFFAGSNAAWAHPVLFRRIEDARTANPSMKVIVADPRRTDTAAIADLHLPLVPGSDVMLFNGLLHIMLWEGWVDTGYIAAHTSGFDALKATVRDCTPDVVAATCGLKKEDLLTAARWFAGITPEGGPRRPTLSLYCQGLNQSSSGTDKNAALINLHLATGQIGRPGAGPFSLTGQPNAMGGREVGGLANLLPGHRDVADAAHRAEVAALWGVPQLPERPGKSAVEMFEAAADGEVKALWIACTNPAQSLPDQATVRRALQRAEFVVLQEAFATTATAPYADLLLPATTWGEKTGTVTNSERRISRVRSAAAPPGQAMHDWAIATRLATRLERQLRPGLPTLFPYDPADAERAVEAIWTEHRESTRGRDLDIGGMSYEQLEAAPLQWPMPAGASAGRERLYEDGRFPTADGRARFADVAWRPPAEAPDARYPFALNTGRLRDQWHGMSRTGTLGRLFGHAPEPSVQLHPQDMARRRVAAGELVHVTSRRGSILVPAQPDATVQPGQAFMAMHWGPEFLGGLSSVGEPLAGVNALTSPARCPTSGQPELKHAAVKILRAELPWTVLAMAWLPPGELMQRHGELREAMSAFPFATCVPFGRERTGLLFRAAAHEPAPRAMIDRLAQLLTLEGPHVLRYADARRGQYRSARLVRGPSGDTHLDAMLLAGDTRAGSWMQALLQDAAPAQDYGRLLLSPGATPPAALKPAGHQVCTCENVSDLQIEARLARCSGDEAARLRELQLDLRCGTGCGSCLPELRRRVRQSLPQPQGA